MIWFFNPNLNPPPRVVKAPVVFSSAPKFETSMQDQQPKDHNLASSFEVVNGLLALLPHKLRSSLTLATGEQKS